MNTTPQALDESLLRLSHANEESFFSQLKSLEDFLASNNHTLESALAFVFENKTEDPVVEAKAQDISRRTRELYQYRDFLISQRNNSAPEAKTNLAPSRMRRLARV
jgi:hypothetical protein